MLCLVFTRKAGGRDLADATTGLHCYSGLWACWGRCSLLEEPAVCDGRPCVSAATGEERPSNARLGRPWPGRSCLRLLAAAHWSSAQQQHRWRRPGFKLPSSQAARSREFFQYLRLLRCTKLNTSMITLQRISWNWKVYFLKVYFMKVYFPKVYFPKLYFPKA